MKIFAGLGNPGAKYARNRHNIGFMAVEEIASAHGFSPWRGRFQGSVTEGVLGGEKVLLLRPETFMNLSGQSVGEALRFYKLGPEDLVVFHDEIDLAPGRIKLKQGGGHAGHNGLRSIHQHVGEAYGRVRMGVGHPGRKEAVPGYVLHDFPKADEEWLDDMIRGCADGAEALAKGDGPGFLNAVNRRLNPARNGPKPEASSGAKASPTPKPQPKTPKPAENKTPFYRLKGMFK
ncbi:aminoacyl-tRNA hydrolase [Pseudoroseicyclus sp. H15]